MKATALALLILLTGCTRDTSITDDIFTGIHDDIGQLTQQLPKECKTDAVNDKIGALSARTDLAQKSCNKDLGDCKAESRRWQFRFYGLLIGILTVLGIAIYRKVRKIL